MHRPTLALLLAAPAALATELPVRGVTLSSAGIAWQRAAVALLQRGG
jgi:hypothetical protein